MQRINLKPTDNFENIATEIVKELEEIKKLKEESAEEEKVNKVDAKE